MKIKDTKKARLANNADDSKKNSEKTQMQTKKALLLEVGEKIENIFEDEFDFYDQVEVNFTISNDGEIEISASGIERQKITIW